MPISDDDRRREHRELHTVAIGVFLSQGNNDQAASPVVPGVLTSISRSGAGIAVAEVMIGRTHLAYGPMESDALQLNIVFPTQGQDALLTLPVRPVWLNKESGKDIPPFRLGVEFIEPLSAAILQQLKRQLR